MTSVKSYVSCLRWAGAKKALFSLANRHGLEFKVLDEDKGWLRHTLYFEVSGETLNVADFFDDLERSVEAYNRL